MNCFGLLQDPCLYSYNLLDLSILNIMVYENRLVGLKYSIA